SASSTLCASSSVAGVGQTMSLAARSTPARSAPASMRARAARLTSSKCRWNDPLPCRSNSGRGTKRTAWIRSRSSAISVSLSSCSASRAFWSNFGSPATPLAMRRACISTRRLSNVEPITVCAMKNTTAPIATPRIHRLFSCQISWTSTRSVLLLFHLAATQHVDLEGELADAEFEILAFGRDARAADERVAGERGEEVAVHPAQVDAADRLALALDDEHLVGLAARAGDAARRLFQFERLQPELGRHRVLQGAQ